jgi:hypothetical protein
VFFTEVPEDKIAKNRVHLDVRLTRADVDHLVDIGAQILTEATDEQNWVVLADPEGNEFCAILP